MLTRICATLVAPTVVAFGLAMPAAHATTITDPAGDFLATFTGTKSGDLDVLSTFATFDGTSFHIGGTLNAPVGTLSTGLYVFGVNRGAATSNFAAIGLPGVVFDSVITMTAAGVLGGRDLVAGTALTLPAGAAHINGATFSIDVPLSLLPSLGLTPLQYGFNLWPRDSAAPTGGNAQIADFAPNATTFQASAVPEPWSIASLGAGLAFLTLGRSRRKRG